MTLAFGWGEGDAYVPATLRLEYANGDLLLRRFGTSGLGDAAWAWPYLDGGEEERLLVGRGGGVLPSKRSRGRWAIGDPDGGLLVLRGSGRPD